MHQHAVTIEQFADIHEKLEVFGYVDEGPIMTTIGKHPSLGSCVLLQRPANDLVLLSEVPYDRQPTDDTTRDALTRIRRGLASTPLC